MKRMLAICVASLAAAAVLESPSLQAADVSHGEELAKRWCASCHIVAREQRESSSDAPPFSTIARNPNFTVDRLAYFLLDPHPKMPEMSLTRSEANDLAVYIAAQGKQ